MHVCIHKEKQCMFLCLYMFVWVLYVYTCLYAFIYVYICLYMFVYVYMFHKCLYTIFICAYMFVNVSIYIYICRYVCVYICVYVYIYMLYMFIYVYICLYLFLYVYILRGLFLNFLSSTVPMLSRSRCRSWCLRDAAITGFPPVVDGQAKRLLAPEL